MNRHNFCLGALSEEEALKYLEGIGYRVLETNYKSWFGEIDIIADDKSVICFIEVKSRSSLRFGYPKEAVSRHKQRKISQSASVYLKEKNLPDKSCRFDVLSVLYDKEKNRKFELIKGAFTVDGEC